MWEIYTFAGLYIVCSIVRNWWWFKMVIGPDDKTNRVAVKEETKDEV